MRSQYWREFRHTYSTLLRSVGTEFKVMQELLRHSSLRSRLDIYTQAISPAKHAAQAAVLALVGRQAAASAKAGGQQSDVRNMASALNGRRAFLQTNYACANIVVNEVIRRVVEGVESVQVGHGNTASVEDIIARSVFHNVSAVPIIDDVRLLLIVESVPGTT